jgi:hypothetical protein
VAEHSSAGQEDGRALCLDTRHTFSKQLYICMAVHSPALALLAMSIDATATLFIALRRTDTHNVGPVRLGICRLIHRRDFQNRLSRFYVSLRPS